jgi:hypothetical protein
MRRRTKIALAVLLGLPVLLVVAFVIYAELSFVEPQAHPDALQELPISNPSVWPE